MNKIYFKILLVAVTVLCFSSCSEDKLDTFEGENNIFFSLKKWPTPSELPQRFAMEYEGIEYWWSYRLTKAIEDLSASFQFIPIEYTTLKVYVPVSLMGHISETDRNIGYRVLPSSTAVEGEDFSILAAFVPADKVDGGFVVELSRKNLREGVTLKIDFELIPNENFETNFTTIAKEPQSTETTSMTTFTLFFSDDTITPPLWSAFSAYFGTFSKKKLDILLNIVGVSQDVMYSTYFFTEYWGLCEAWGRLFKRYLTEQADAGTPVYEEDGVTRMTWGPYIP